MEGPASLFEDTNPRSLKELLSQIHSKETALPDFQRDFVWDPSATQELIVSIASNYPAGSLLRVRNTQNLFAFREFEGAPAIKNSKITYLVLDGQQRLTSLYQAFYGVGDHRYYIDLRKLLESGDFEDAIFHLKVEHKTSKRLEDFGVQANELVLPLNVLRGGAGDFSKWSVSVRRKAPKGDQDRLEDDLAAIGARWIQAVDDYHFPVVTLSDKTDAAAICTIFETLNRTGVKLSPFELLTARFWPEKVKLRDLWEKARAKHSIIGDFEIDPYYMLQVISLASRSAPGCKRKEVLTLESKTVTDWWDRATDSLAYGLKMLRDECGVLVPGWLPYNTIVIPLAAAIARAESTGGPKVGANRQRLKQWFWCSVLGQTYENSPNSQAARDVIELVAWLGGKGEPVSVRDFRFNPKVLQDTTHRQRALYRATMCLVLRRGTLDFHKASTLTPMSILEESVDDHHVFPQKYLDDRSISTRHRDSILNRTLIDRRTNIRISDRAPSEYLTEIRSELDKVRKSAFRDVIESHLLPADKRGPLMNDHFEQFLEWRQQALWDEI